MKYIISILLLSVYLVGLVKPSWTLIDFYAHRNEYTQKYCVMLDQGITQCRASCYLDRLMKAQHEDKAETQIVASQQYKSAELISTFAQELDNKPFSLKKRMALYQEEAYSFDLLHFVFHPPKG